MFHLFFPVHCLVCHQRVKQSIALCCACKKDLPYIGKQEVYKGDLAFRSVFHYQGYIEQWIKEFKFSHQLHVGRLLGALFMENIKNLINYPSVVIPVPLHKDRLINRGFNQVIELARPLCHHPNFSLSTQSLIRNKNTKPQTECTAQERIKNTKGAFKIKNKIDTESIILIDDVITTGSTIKNCENTLKKAYPDKNIRVLSLAVKV